MGALIWDDTGKKYFESGVDHGVIYPVVTTGSGTSATTGYGTGVVWNGLTAVTESPSGAEPTDLWADNIKYATLRSAEDFGMTIEAYTYPDEFAVCDGSVQPVAGVTIGQQARGVFGFSYRTYVGDDVSGNQGHYKLHLVYGCTASPSERAYSTINDSPDAITFSWEITTVPVNVTNYKPTACITIDSRTANETNLKALEKILYGVNASTGVEESDPELPTPDEVIAIITSGTRIPTTD